MDYYIVIVKDNNDWARWQVKAESKEDLMNIFNEYGFTQSNATLLASSLRKPLSGTMTIENKTDLVLLACDQCQKLGSFNATFDDETYPVLYSRLDLEDGIYCNDCIPSWWNEVSEWDE